MTEKNPELIDLLGKLCNGLLTAPDNERLIELLGANSANRRLYTDYLGAHLTLVDHARRGDPDESPAAERPESLSREDVEVQHHAPGSKPSGSWFASGSRVAFALAVLVLLAVGMGLLQTSSRDAERPGRLAHAGSDPDSSAPRVVEDAEPLYLAQVTDLTPDVVWGDTATSQEFLLRVRRGDRIEIVSGLVQMDYFSGAQLILHGPCAFVPTGDSSGRLEYGNLTGKVSKGDFVLTTPTAKVIDLGTEFGVSVDGVARTDVCVFDGEVRLFGGFHGGDDVNSLLLSEGMKASVASGRIVAAPEFDERRFARELPIQADQGAVRDEISLVDLLSGSQGGRPRIAGVIAPDTGESDRQPWLRDDGPGYSVASGFQATRWHPFVDGVFIPSESGLGVRTDSSGHAIDLPACTGRTWGPIWSRRRIFGAKPVAAQDDYWGTDTLEGVIARLSDCKTGMIGIHSNVGVTFDLDAVRRHSGRSIQSFSAVVGNLDNSMKRIPEWSAKKRLTADVRVLIDGQLHADRLDFGRDDGELIVRTRVAESDRFLTIVCTDASRGEASGTDAYDHVVLIDPVLTLASTQEDN